MSFLWLFLGFVLLVIGGEYLVRASVGLSFKLKLSKMIIGMTVVSFATSAPELLVSLNAALTGSPAIALNNVIGSNIDNIGMVLGITAIVGAIGVDRSFYRVNWPVMMLFSMLLFYFLKNDNQLVFLEGLILFVGLIVFLVLLIRLKDRKIGIEEVDETLAQVSSFKIFIWLIIGGTALYFGSDWLVDGAKEVAMKFGISEAVISVSMVAIGTSVPELAASVIAAAKKEKAISLGNLLGSNIFNIGSVLGLTAMIKPIPVTAQEIVSRDILWMLAFAAILVPLVLLPKRSQINSLKGFFLVVCYGIFIFLIFTS